MEFDGGVGCALWGSMMADADRMNLMMTFERVGVFDDRWPLASGRLCKSLMVIGGS